MNLADQIYIFLGGLDAATVANWFIWPLVLVFLFALVTLKLGKFNHLQHAWPAVLTTAGILGTFIGISIGLVNFDPADIKASIPQLLDGLKTAFLTSIVGIIGSIALKIIQAFADDTSNTVVEIGPAHIYDSLKAQEALLGKIVEGNLQLKSAIAGDGDSSLVTQIQKMRQQSHDDTDRLREEMTKEFRDFAEKVSEIGSKQLIEALSGVIKDFNDNLTEQFGENFKRLDDSVKKLVDWQDNYKEQLQQMDQSFQISTGALSQSEQKLGVISEHTAAIPQNMQALESIIRASDAQLSDMEKHLEGFAQVRDRAVDAIPALKSHIDLIMEEMKRSIKAASNHYEIMIDDADSLIKQFRDSSGELQKEFSDTVSSSIKNAVTQLDSTTSTMTSGTEKIARSVNEAASSTDRFVKEIFEKWDANIQQHDSRMEQVIARNANELNQKTQAMFSGVEKQLNESVGKLEQIVNESFKTFDSSMQKEIERLVQTMANNLGSITNKFVGDYAKLTAGMEKVIRENSRLDN